MSYGQLSRGIRSYFCLLFLVHAVFKHLCVGSRLKEMYRYGNDSVCKIGSELLLDR